MSVLALHQISTPVFHAWHSIDLDGLCVGDSLQCHFYFFLRAFTPLPMCHGRDYALGILMYAQWVFKRCQF